MYTPLSPDGLVVKPIDEKKYSIVPPLNDIQIGDIIMSKYDTSRWADRITP